MPSSKRRTALLRAMAIGLALAIALAAYLFSCRERALRSAQSMVADHRPELDAIALKVAAAPGTPNQYPRLFASPLGDVQMPPDALGRFILFRISVGSCGLGPGGTAFYLVRLIDPEHAATALAAHPTEFAFTMLDDCHAFLAWK